MPELIDDGTTGFLVTNPAEAHNAVGNAAKLDRAAIRNATVTKFDTATMIDQYLAAYHTVLDSDRRP